MTDITNNYSDTVKFVTHVQQSSLEIGPGSFMCYCDNMALGSETWGQYAILQLFLQTLYEEQKTLDKFCSKVYC